MAKHIWKLDKFEEGAIDEMAAEWEDSDGTGHNGPRCTVCGFDFCMYCAEEHPREETWDSECPGEDEG